MPDESPQLDELHELLAAWLGGDLRDERRAALLARLRDDAAFRAAFVTEARTFAILDAVQRPEPHWLALQDELGLGESDAAMRAPRTSPSASSTTPAPPSP